MQKEFWIILTIGVTTYLASSLYTPIMVSLHYDEMAQVVSSIEMIKQENGSTYPAMYKTEFAKTANNISNHLGGVENTVSLKGWTYECVPVWVPGATSTVAVTTIASTTKISDIFDNLREKVSAKFPKLEIDPTRSSVKVADIVREKMRKSFPHWEPDAPGTPMITLYVKNTYCK